MLVYIVLLWVLIKLQAPIWCYAIIILGILMQTINFILDIAIKVEEKKLNREAEKLAESQHQYEMLKERIGSNRE